MRSSQPPSLCPSTLRHAWLQATPNWMTTILLAALLTALTWKLATRAAATWRKESAAYQKGDAELEQPLLQAGELPGGAAGRIPTHQEILNNAFRSTSARLCPSSAVRNTLHVYAVLIKHCISSDALQRLFGDFLSWQS